MILKIIIGAVTGAYLASLLYQWQQRRKNKRFRENLQIGNNCFVFAKVEHKEVKIGGRIKYINRDDHLAYFQCAIRRAQGWYSINDLYIT